MSPVNPNAHTTLAALCASAILLAACGGDPDPAQPPPATPPVTLAGVVADGPLSGATVCYDLNDNAACDAGEPTSAATDADGKFSVDVPAADAGKHVVLAVVPATAVDKDTGAAVGTAFTLKAPASSSTAPFVSPLSTLVVDIAAAQGLSATDADAAVKTQLGLTNSPLANFVAGADTQAGTFAKTVNTVIIEVSKLADTAAVSAEGKKALVAAVTTGDLKSLAARITSAAAGTPAQVAAAVTQSVLADRNLSAATVADQAAFAVATAAPVAAAAATGPFVSVRRFAYTDANNYQLQAFVGDNTTGADGTYPFNEVRANVAAGVSQPFNRNQVYWHKALNSWQVCDRAWQVGVTTPAKAASGAAPATPQQSLFCGASVSRTKVGEYDVAGQKMADVVAAIRASTVPDVPGFDTDAAGLPAKWGPDPALLGTAVFPAGSKFTKREATNDVGETKRYSLTDKPRVIPASGTGTYRQAATLEDMKRMSGNLVNTATVVTSANTVGLDDLPAVQADPLLSPIKRYRVAFDPTGSAVRYFACDVLASANTSQNCVALGEGTSSIAVAGDSRVLSFETGYPAVLTTALSRKRLFVERSGAVFGGAVDLERTRFQQRPNTIAWNALRTALGIAEPAASVAPAGPGPFETVHNWTFANALNYTLKLHTGDSSQVDGQGYFGVTEQRLTVAAGAVVPFVRNTLYWTGTEWFDCPANAAGYFFAKVTAPFNSSYCKVYFDERYNSATITLDGRLMADVLRDIRWYATKEDGFDYAGWGPNPDVLTALATAKFPAGATMTHNGNLRTATPIGINTAARDQVRLPPATGAVPAYELWPFAASIAELIARNPGDLLGVAANGLTTQAINGFDLPAAPSPQYTTRVDIRVAFDANGNKARFYQANVEPSGNRSNFVKVLDTTYTVETLGGKRVLRYTALPAGFERDFNYQSVFAEHLGGVWYSYTSSTPTTPIYAIRINSIALRAIEQALGVVR